MLSVPESSSFLCYHGIPGYLCRVAAINAAGEVGPATPDAVSLTLPPPGPKKKLQNHDAPTYMFLAVYSCYRHWLPNGNGHILKFWALEWETFWSSCRCLHHSPSVCLIEESLCSVSPNTPSTFGAGWSWGFKSQCEPKSQVFVLLVVTYKHFLYLFAHLHIFCWSWSNKIYTFWLELSWFQDITGKVLHAFGDEAILVACGHSRVPMATCSPWPSTRTLLATKYPWYLYHMIYQISMLQLSTLLVPEARQTKGDCSPLPGGMMENLETAHHMIEWKCFFGLVKIMISQGHHLLPLLAPDHFFFNYALEFLRDINIESIAKYGSFFTRAAAFSIILFCIPFSMSCFPCFPGRPFWWFALRAFQWSIWGTKLDGFSLRCMAKVRTWDIWEVSQSL